MHRDVFPRVVRITLATSPAGLQLRLDGQPVTTPHAFDSVVGVSRAIDAPDQQADGAGYAFERLVRRRRRRAVIATPPVGDAYTARFIASWAPPARRRRRPASR